MTIDGKYIYTLNGLEKIQGITGDIFATIPSNPSAPPSPLPPRDYDYGTATIYRSSVYLSPSDYEGKSLTHFINSINSERKADMNINTIQAYCEMYFGLKPDQFKFSKLKILSNTNIIIICISFFVIFSHKYTAICLKYLFSVVFHQQ